jgi:hypothetical protein
MKKVHLTLQNMILPPDMPELNRTPPVKSEVKLKSTQLKTLTLSSFEHGGV